MEGFDAIMASAVRCGSGVTDTAIVMTKVMSEIAVSSTVCV